MGEKGTEREKQRETNEKKVIKMQSDRTDARSHVVQHPHFTKGETKAQGEHVT